MRVNASDIETEGVTKSFVRSSDSGNDLECRFCPDCGTRLFHLRPGYGERFNIKAGTLDDPSWLKPAGHIWTRSKQPHVIIADGALCYERQPENYAELEQLWQAMIAS